MNLLQANAFKIPLKDKSCHICTTSPPYYSLRKYSGEQEFVFGGDKNCEHAWDEHEVETGSAVYKGTERWQHHGETLTTKPEIYEIGRKGEKRVKISSYCSKCNAWRGAYGLEPTLQMYIDHTVEWCREVWRVLRDDATFWLNLGDSYNGSGGDHKKHHKNDAGFQGETFRGVTARNDITLKPKDLMGVPWRVALALQADGWYLRSDIIWHKTNPMPESVTDRPTKSHEYLFLLTKNKKYYYDIDAMREARTTTESRADGVVRDREFGYDSKQGILQERKQDQYNKRQYTGFNDRWNKSPTAGRNKRTVWTIATAPYSGAHFATYPPALVEPCIKVGTSERGVCPECGDPWERVSEVWYEPQNGKGYKTETPRVKGRKAGHDVGGVTPQEMKYGTAYRRSKTTGWRPTCDHYDEAHRAFQRVKSDRKKYQQDIQNEWFKRVRKRALEFAPCDRCNGTGIDPEDEPEIVCCDCIGAGFQEIVPASAIVLDPFNGSGTTMQVAHKLGRTGIGLDISAEYIQLARERLGIKALEEWEHGKQTVETDLEGLPLFTPQ